MTLNEIIECIKEVKEDYWEDDGYGYATADCQRITTALDEAIERLEQTGWIPVSERLPEECSGVLVYCPENKNIFLAYLEIGKWYIFSPNADEPIDEPIVAWMPLPAPFETQESEDKEINNG